MSFFDRLKNLFGNDSKKKESAAPATKPEKSAAPAATEEPVKNAAPASATPVTETAPVTNEEIPAPIASENLKNLSGDYLSVRYDKSFAARLALSEDELKGYYNDVKKAFLTYTGVRARLSWKGELFTRGHAKLGDLRVRGKSLYLYLAIDPTDLDGTKYRGEEASDAKALADLPFCYVINGERKALWATELVERVCVAAGAEKGNVPENDFAAEYPTATEEELIEKMQIKEIVTRSEKPKDGPWSKSELIPAEGIETFRTEVLYREYASVTLEQIEAAFSDGATVDLSGLLALGLVPASADAWRLLGQGNLTKKLTVKTNYCTMATAGKITANGGKVEIYKSTTRFGGQ